MKIGDTVTIKTIEGWPLDTEFLIDSNIKKGDLFKIINISIGFFRSPDGQFKTLYLLELLNKNITHWFTPHQFYVSSPQLSFEFPHKCPRCSCACYIGGMNNVDCSNPNCPTKE